MESSQQQELRSRLRWIDTHVHVSDRNSDGRLREGMLEALLFVLDRADAELRFVISPDGIYNTYVKERPEGMLIANRMIYELCRQAPDRLFGSCLVNPHFLREALHIMDLAFGEWGFVQLGEMLPYMFDFQMDSEAGEALVRHAADYGIPVQIHLGTYWSYKMGASGHGMTHMEDLLSIAERVPEAKYVLAHAIGCGTSKELISWADWFLDVLVGYFASYPDNFWIEIRDFHCPALPRTLREVPPTRLLAGTDWTTRLGPPFPSYGTIFGVAEADNPFPPRVASLVGFLRQAGAGEPTIEHIAWRNAAELYRLHLK